MFNTYDVIVVGAGHAGCEAAASAANMGCKTLLVTMSLQNIAQMSCNPAMGGIAKGQIVREIDALGGYSGIVSDKTAIQFKMLNKSKGPAMWSPRVQSDRMRFAEEWRLMLENTPNLDFYQEMVKGLLIKNNKIEGVVTSLGIEIKAKTVVLTVGTFLGGQIHIGLENYSGGRAGDPPSIALAKRLRELPFRVDRLKTGTPPRIDARTIDFSLMQPQPGDNPTPVFSFMGKREQHPRQIPCHITRTNNKTHDIIRAGLDRSPLYSGIIEFIILY